MTAVETRGAGRRLTPDQEARGRQLFAEGRTEREVAKALGVGASTAHRIRERMEASAAPEATPAAPAGPDAGEQDTPDTTGTPGAHEALGTRSEPQLNQELNQGPEPVPETETLEALRDRRDALAAQHGALLDQAQAAREAVEDCDTRRVEALAGGGDSARFAAERTRLEAENARLSADAGVVGRWLLEVDAEIGRREQVRELAALRRELVAVVAERDTVCARTGARMRLAVRVVADAAAEFVQALADDQAAVQRAEELAAAVTARAVALGEPGPEVPPATSTALWVHPDVALAGRPLALLWAINHGRRGDVDAVSAQLGEACGWLPMTGEEEAAERERHAERLAAMDAQQAPAPPSQPWTRQDPGSVAFDAAGNEIPPWMIRPPHPRDVYMAPAAGVGPQHDPGYRVE